MILVKEEFLTNAKTIRAIRGGGYEVLALWLAMKAYASQRLTNGFVPDEQIDLLPGVPPRPKRALKAMLECGTLNPDGTRSVGLVERVEHGWILHDYLDHAPSREEEEKRREKARKRKARWRADRLSRPVSYGTNNGTIWDVPHGTDASVPRPPTGGGARVPNQTKPNQTAATSPQDPTGSARVPRERASTTTGEEPPKSQNDAEAISNLQHRVKLCRKHGTLDWCCPQEWPEVVMVVEHYRRETGQQRLLTSAQADRGLARILDAFEAGLSPEQFMTAVQNVSRTEWWLSANPPRDLSDLSMVVISKALPRDNPRVAEAIARAARRR